MSFRKLKILYISNMFNNISGAGLIALKTYELFKKTHDVEIFTVNKHSDYSNHRFNNLFIKPYDTPILYLKNLNNFYYNKIVQKNLEELFKDFYPDIVHIHSPWSSALTCSIFDTIDKHNIPIIMTLHDAYLICPSMTLVRKDKPCNALCKGVNKFHCAFNNCLNNLELSLRTSIGAYVNKKTNFEKKVRKFITPSIALQNIMIKYNDNVNKENIVTINNCLISEESNTNPNYSNNGYFLYIGRLSKEKGVNYLLQAIKDLPKDIKLRIVGTGKEENNLKQYVKENNLDNVEFVGFKNRKEIEEEYQNCIATILPCNWFEIFGMTNIESFINGKPVIASNIGGIPEIVEHNVNGLLFEPTNVEQLKECILKYWNNPELAVEHGKNGYQKAITQYTEERYYNELMKVYEEVITHAKTR